MQVPPPILSQYDWAGITPFDAQKDTAQLLACNNRAFVLSDMGTGKTLSTLFACDFLMKSQDIKKVLVVAPLSTLTSVWEREIFSWMPHRTSVSLHGTSDKRHKLLESDVDFYIVNHDGLRVIEHAIRDRDDINCVVIDELAVYRNARSGRWKTLNGVLKTKHYAWGLTGQPTPNAPTDAYGQIKLLSPDRVPKFFKAFQAETMYQVTQFRWLAKPGANDVVRDAMQPAIRFTRDDMVDLPPTTYTTLEVELSPEQKKAYKSMWNDFALQYDNGETTAVNSGVQLFKLLQIACGFAYTETKTIELPHAERLTALKSIIDGTPNKVIVYAPFKHTCNQLKDDLSQHYSVDMVNGDVKKTERDAIFNLFQNTKNPRVLIAHPQVVAHGLTLTAADTIVWYSPHPSLEIYAQANARITRPGQANHTHIVHIESSAVERKIYKRLQAKGDAQSILLEMFKDYKQEGLF